MIAGFWLAVVVENPPSSTSGFRAISNLKFSCQINEAHKGPGGGDQVGSIENTIVNGVALRGGAPFSDDFFGRRESGVFGVEGGNEVDVFIIVGEPRAVAVPGNEI